MGFLGDTIRYWEFVGISPVHRDRARVLASVTWGWEGGGHFWSMYAGYGFYSARTFSPCVISASQ